jgi:alkylated DNA repair protein (DNA oxidative demethylase)
MAKSGCANKVKLGAPPLFEPAETWSAPGAVLLRGFAYAEQHWLISDIEMIASRAPFRQMVTRSGFVMSVGMTSCGVVGWISDRKGYRYTAVDPLSGRAWPSMPAGFVELAKRAAFNAGYASFTPDTCLINRYLPNSRMSLHQDRQEIALDAPVVSVSLGLSATFLWGGAARTDRATRIFLHHADVMVWGGPSRLNFHGIAPLKPGHHPVLDNIRYNLTFRRH